MSSLDFNQAKKAQVRSTTPFLCRIGSVQAELNILIEPDPSGDGQGTLAHFHCGIHCPKIKSVDPPEPDRTHS